MEAFTPLILKLCNHFSLHPSRLKTLAGLIFSVMQSGRVHQVSLSHYVESPTLKSALRRVERFFQHQSLKFCDYARAIVEMLGFKGKFDLCLDRTNWKFGTKDINYLVLSWRITKHISLPLFAIELDKAGNSNALERIFLLEEFDKVFGFSRIGSLLADREFIGDKWIRMLTQYHIPFFIRTKDNILVPYGEKPLHIKEFFKHLSSKQSRVIEKEMHGSTVYFAGTRAKDGALVIVLTNQPFKAKDILNIYRKRWSIEEMFRKLKTSGFNWEGTHMKDSKRLTSLLIVLSIAAFLIYSVGITINTPWKKTVRAPLWSVFRRGMITFQRTFGQSLLAAINLLLSSLKTLYQLMELQK